MTDNTHNKGPLADEAFSMLQGDDLRALLAEHQARLAALPADTPELERNKLKLDIASDYLALEEKAAAWQSAQETLPFFLDHQHWQEAVEAYDVMYQSEQPESAQALAHGVWLAVSFPVAPQTTIAMLQHIVDETPADSDGAAVAAITAHYIAGLRADEGKRESLQFLATQIIAQVAKRHSQVSDQEMLEFWMDKLELRDPAVFLPRLARVLEIIVEDRWWFDREQLRRLIPDN